MSRSRDPLDGTGRRGNPIFKGPEDMWEKWIAFVEHCMTYEVIEKTVTKSKHKGTTVDGEDRESDFEDFKEKKLIKPKTPTMDGFTIYCNLGSSAMYKYYLNNPEYVDVVTDIRMQSKEVHRQLFEQGSIPTQLSGLWMSQFGYSTKVDTNIKAEQTINVKPSSHAIIEDMFKESKTNKGKED